MALAVPGRTRDSDALLSREARSMFLVPWRDRTLVGVWHRIVDRDPDAVGLTRSELCAFIDEMNLSYPALQLTESEVTIAGFGLVPFGAAARQRPGSLSFGKQSRLIDHEREQGVPGLISLISVRYTVARRDAVAALDAAERQLGPHGDGAASAREPLPGGDIADFSAFRKEQLRCWPAWLPQDACEGFVQNYGTCGRRIIALGEQESALRQCLPGSCVSHAEIVYAMREEMAERMTDVVLRRTDLGSAGHPGTAALDELQDLMRSIGGWSAERTAAERAAVDRHFERYLAPAVPLAPSAGAARRGSAARLT
jgi:glycerol-3-phosphate dehydrogenase